MVRDYVLFLDHCVLTWGETAIFARTGAVRFASSAEFVLCDLAFNSRQPTPPCMYPSLLPHHWSGGPAQETRCDLETATEGIRVAPADGGTLCSFL